MDGNTARSIRNLRRKENYDNFEDKILEKVEVDIENSKTQNQMDYFGYVLEPFNMKNEREFGNIDNTGFFRFDKEKEKEINDPWLESIDENPYYGLKINENNEENNEENSENKEENIENTEEKELEIETKKGNYMLDDGDYQELREVEKKELLERLLELIENNKNEENLTTILKNLKKNNNKKEEGFKKNVRKKKKIDNENENVNKKEKVLKKTIKKEDNKGKLNENNDEKIANLVIICNRLLDDGWTDIYALNKDDIKDKLLELLKKK